MAEKNEEVSNYFLYDFVKVTAGVPGLLFFRPKLIYENEKARERIRGGALLIANHNGFFDPIFLMMGIWYRRHHFICLKEFFDRPVRAFFFRQFHCIPIDRENTGTGTIRRVSEALRAGKLVSMFPEGRVSRDTEELQSFRSGMVLMALMGRSPVVPVYIGHRKHWFSRLRIAVGEPRDMTGKYGSRPSMEEIGLLTKELKEKEDELRKMLKEEGR